MVPIEHGAWAMLLLPYFIGISIGGGLSGREILGLLAVLLLFFSRQPLLMLVKTKASEAEPSDSKKRMLWRNFFLFFGSGCGIFLWLLLRGRLRVLLLIGAIAALLSILHIRLSRRRKESCLTGEFLGVGIITLSAPLGIIFS